MNLPRRNRESFLHPPFRNWPHLIERNLELFRQYRLFISGLPFLKIREGVREKLSLLGVPSDFPLLLTGHQPHFIHPGIWFRFFLLNRAKEELGINSAAFVLDSDLNRGLSVSVPREFEGELLLREIPLPLGNLIFEVLSSPSKQDWEEFLEGIEDCLSFPEALSARENFGKIRYFPWKNEAFSDFYSRLRRFYEGEPEYPEFPLSKILKQEFQLFFLHIARNAEAFALAYNASNARFRKKKGARSGNTPFPDLRIAPGEVELPFWLVDKGERFPLFLDAKGILKSGKKEWGKFEEAFREWKIRPRAATLTMFLRLFACDLFLHGLGGGDYEEVVDFMIQEFFCVEPPAFAQASLTLYFPGFDSEGGRKLKEKIRRMRENPEEFLPPLLVAQLQDLIFRKQALRPKKLSKEEYLELKEINSHLLSFLGTELQELEREANKKEERGKTLSFREYPFFFFDPEEMRCLARQA